MSDEDTRAKDGKVSWVYELNKEQLIEQLKLRKIDLEESEKFDVLRKRLVDAVKLEIRTTASENKEEDTNESDRDSNMSGENNKLEFCLREDDWELFIERLEILFDAKDTKEEKKGINIADEVR